MFPYTLLPDEIINVIFQYIEPKREAMILKCEISNYEMDHNDCYTKKSGQYLIKNILSFSEYYFDKLMEPFLYDTYNEAYYIKN